MKHLLYGLFALLLSAQACAPAAAPMGDAPKEEPVLAQPSGSLDEKAMADYYSGKTVRFVVGFAPGGGFDTYARAIARHIGKHIPGKPAVIVDNMTGGASLVAANYVYAATKPDGLTIGHWNGGQVVQQLLGAEGVEFDARKFRFLGVPTPDNPVCALRKESGVTKLSEMMNAPKQIILGSTGAGTATEDVPRVLQAALGVNVKLVSGYAGTANVRQAADSGEVMGGCWGWESVKVTWKAALDSGEVKVVGQLARDKLKDLPNVEHALDLAKTDETKQLIHAGIIVPGVITRPFSVHPDTPLDKLQALRQAFANTFKDPEFLEEAQRARLDVDPMSGEDVEAMVRELFKTPDPVKAKLKTVLAP